MDYIRHVKAEGTWPAQPDIPWTVAEDIVKRHHECYGDSIGGSAWWTQHEVSVHTMSGDSWQCPDCHKVFGVQGMAMHASARPAC